MTEQTAAGDDAEARAARERREAKLESQRKWREANPERSRDYKREWIAKNPERHKQHQRDAAAKKKAREEHRAAEVARVRKWRDENPERVREKGKAWDAANPERRREIARNYYHRNKEKRREANLERQAANRADPEQAAKRKAWRDENREHLNELQRKRREADPEANREYQREWRRVEKRRLELGLPKVRKHRKTKLEVLTHSNQADEYWNRRLTKPRLAKIAKEGRGVAFDANAARTAAHDRVEENANRVLGGYLVHRVAPELIQAEYNLINVSTFREELRMDLIARQARGGPPFDLDTELHRAAGRRVFERMARQLGVPVYVPPEARKGNPEQTRQMLAQRIDNTVAGAKAEKSEVRSSPRRTKRTPGATR